jgi:hypothetical protein
MISGYRAKLRRRKNPAREGQKDNVKTFEKMKTMTMRTSSWREGEFVFIGRVWKQQAGLCEVPRVPRDKVKARRYLRHRFGSCRNLRRWGLGGWAWEISKKSSTLE